MNSISDEIWNALRKKTFFVTGSTGLIGASLINTLAQADEELNLDLHVIALARDAEKAKRKLADSSCITTILGGVEHLPEISEDIDYIVHAASITASKSFVANPVEVIETSINGTSSVLKLAREKQIEGFVYLSSMEVYGYPERGHKVTEDEVGAFDVTAARNCYPLSKIMCENLCMSFFHEYDVPVKIVRLTQTFGPGVEYDDGRVFAEFARCAIEGKNIVLKTKGETERSYLYTQDAVTSLLAVLLNGKAGEIYNAANEATYCSIAQMAELVADMSGIRVEFDLQETANLGYANTLYMDLDTFKLQKLGWGASFDLHDMFETLIADMRRQ